jgi:predicted membrane metal-binding protein
VEAPSFDERLVVPWSWWPAVLLIVAFGIFEVASGFTVVVYVPVSLFFVGFFIVPLVLSGRTRVKVEDGVLSAGKSDLPLNTVTSIQPLDRERTRMQLGPQADPASHTVVRGWIGPSVMVRLSNPDPVPYWLVSTRRPEELAAAIKAERAAIRATRASK